MSWKIVLPLLMAALSTGMYFGAKFARVRAQMGTILIISALCSILLLVPWVGWILSVYCMVRLSSRLTEAEFWPDAMIIAFIAMAPALLLRWLIY